EVVGGIADAAAVLHLVEIRAIQLDRAPHVRRIRIDAVEPAVRLRAGECDLGHREVLVGLVEVGRRRGEVLRRIRLRTGAKVALGGGAVLREHGCGEEREHDEGLHGAAPGAQVARFSDVHCGYTTSDVEPGSPLSATISGTPSPVTSPIRIAASGVVACASGVICVPETRNSVEPSSWQSTTRSVPAVGALSGSR